MTWEWGVIALVIAWFAKSFLGGRKQPDPSPKVQQAMDDLKEVMREEREDVSAAGDDLARNLDKPIADRVRDILKWRRDRLSTGDDTTDGSE